MSWLVFAAVTFADFSFLQGNWCASALGGDVVERWDPPFGNAMTGTMTVVNDGLVEFHEFFVIVEENGQWQLRLKHFEPDMVSWEARDEVVVFPLSAVKPGSARFEGLLMEKTPAGGLRVEVLGGGPVFNYEACGDS